MLFNSRSKVFSIKENTTNTVRLRVQYEDIEFENMDVMLEFGLIQEIKLEDVRVYIVKDGFPHPMFNMYYGSRIKSIKDKFLIRLVKDLLFLNPGPSREMKARIVELILSRFSSKKKVESDVLLGRVKLEPVLKYVEVMHLLEVIIQSGAMDEYIPIADETVIFREVDNLTKEQKISIRVWMRGAVIEQNYQRVIGQVIDFIKESRPLLRISENSIESTKRVKTLYGKNKGEPASVRVIRNNIGDRNREKMKVYNEGARFSTVKASDKFDKFIAVGKRPLGVITEELGISKSTAVEYRKIKEELGG